jgi:hypothetical protein
LSSSSELHIFRLPVSRTLKKPAFAVMSTWVSTGRSAENSDDPVRTITRSVFSGSDGITVCSGPSVLVNGHAWVLPSNPMQASPVFGSCRSSTSVSDAA